LPNTKPIYSTNLEATKSLISIELVHEVNALLTILAKSANIAKSANLWGMESFMRVESATNAKNHFGEIMDAALREPVMIQRSGRDAAVLMSVEEYKIVEMLSDRYWGELAMEAEKNGFLSAEESESVIQRLLNADT
ncbi:MAG: type II toxin-antitoxin system Phd/YefM family antitoxin, partial [Rickettsiales bacterium]